MKMEETEEFLEMADGFHLFVRRWKPAFKAEKAVVCIHGFGGHSGGFKPLGESLAAGGIDVYGLDLRGFGNSKETDLPRGDTKDFERHMQDIDEATTLVRRNSQCQKLYVLGHSLGALYALWYGAKYPEASDGLILAAPAIEVKPRITQEVRDKFLTLLATAPETMIDARRAAPKTGEVIPDLLRTSRFSVRYCCSIASVLMRNNAFQNAANVKKPTLIIQGEADDEALPSGAKRLFEALAVEDNTLRMLPGVDHFLLGSREQVCSAIMDWLRIH
jgi:alpha-beta hydrolase superfamily lysophospholipase